ncbi:MAG: glycosyltransferase family 2 protein, partial [Gemmatimonadetes bacterium]|nr:glycosyltransferase family 2 protein [Gemmatimonadota bacterium]
LPGVDAVEWLVVDDGSDDRSVDVARAHGVAHVVRLTRHQGLARAFVAGLEAALTAGADIIVNLDADNQYRADDIPNLIAPIQAGAAEIVIGTRPIGESQDFSPARRLLQRLGSWVTRMVSRTDVADAPSGFRAISRAAAMRLHVFNDYTYTVEMVIQAGQKGMAIASVPIRTNPRLRPSRLIRNVVGYINRQVLTMLRIFVTYKPFAFFAAPGALAFTAGFLIGARFLYFYFTGHGAGHVQSLILGALLMGSGFFLVVIGLVADLIAVNRRLLEGLDWRLRQVEETLQRRR